MEPEGVAKLLQRINEGDGQAFDVLVAAVYGELRRMAGSLVRGRAETPTLGPTALVNEAWLRLAQGAPHWDGRAHFFGAAARAMRQVLVARARERAARKRGGGYERVTFEDLDVPAPDRGVDVLALDEALDDLAREDARYTRVMELRYFGGYTLPEIAELTGRSLATVKRDWAYARAWLYERMSR